MDEIIKWMEACVNIETQIPSEILRATVSCGERNVFQFLILRGSVTSG